MFLPAFAGNVFIESGVINVSQQVAAEQAVAWRFP